ncbi:hypothetical protein C0J52_18798 [Blattella germanica]|nr:hypothetical protein C0J52_18798 [Blattella germanica]
MDNIKEEIEESKLEKMEFIDVDENNDDFRLSLHCQNIKLEKQDLIYDLKQDVLDVMDTEFKLNSLACVKVEVDTDSHYQDLIYDLKQDVLDVMDTEFKLNSLACVKEEVDTDSHYQVRKCCL